MAFKTFAVFGLLIVGSGIGFARPQSSLDAEARRRALDGQDMFDPNPRYTYSYQVSNDKEQTYIAQTESRDGDAVNGEYSYVDANGALITVRYQANDQDGYTETREVQEDFIQIRSRPVAPAPAPVPAPVPAAPSSSDLVARIISQLTPFIRETVSSTLSGGQRTQTVAVPARPVAVRPVAVPAPAASQVEATFGVANSGNNIRVETPTYQFATDF